MKPFQNVESVHPQRSVFDLSYSKTMSADMGLLYPVMCDEMVPGDCFSVSHSVVARVMPLVAPILHEINITVHTFFVPYRLLMDDENGKWTDFISGGEDGEDATTLPRMPYPSTFLGSLWDYLGFPEAPTTPITATDTMPLDFPRRAYSFIWNEYYRDENWLPEIDYMADPSDDLLRRAWTKDYFSSCLPWTQRGVAPAFPITGSAVVGGEGIVGFDFHGLPDFTTVDRGTIFQTAGGVNTSDYDTGGGSNHHHTQNGNYIKILDADVTAANAAWNTNGVARIDFDAQTPPVTADLSSATTFDVNTLRTAFQIQKWMERNARAGVRYTEFLRAQFGVSPRDERLQRPEYIGGMKSPVIISEVLQTSESSTGHPQGNMAGHGISVSAERCGKYYAQEFGLVMSLLSIMPKPAYSQGIDRQWLRRTKFDFFFPPFAQLGEQAVEDAEIFWQETDAKNKHAFGFQARYDEMRVKNNMSVGMLRPGQDFDYWTLTRSFASAPSLGAEFIECNPDPRCWAVQVDAPQFVLNVGNHIKAVRPLPALGTPGYIDHH